MKERAKLDRLSRDIDDLPDKPPGNQDSWFFQTGTNGTYFITRVLGRDETGGLDSALDDLILYYTALLKKVGGMNKYLQQGPSPLPIGMTSSAERPSPVAPGTRRRRAGLKVAPRA